MNLLAKSKHQQRSTSALHMYVVKFWRSTRRQEVEQENAISPDCRQPASHTLYLLDSDYLPLFIYYQYYSQLIPDSPAGYFECTLNTYQDLWSKLKLVSVLWDSNSTFKRAGEENSQLNNQANKDKECLKLTLLLHGKAVLLFVLAWRLTGLNQVVWYSSFKGKE